jgi:3-dehydroquinate dehydratase-1
MPETGKPPELPAATKPIVVKGKPLASGRLPAICIPLVGTSAEAIMAELDASLSHGPDAFEWRADYFEAVADPHAVVEAARRLRERAGSVPLLFTCRREDEGGRPTALGTGRRIALYEAVFASGFADLGDFEIGNGATAFGAVSRAARRYGVTLVGSYHDFDRTPEPRALAECFAQAKREGADVAKVAVMPHDPRDVLALLAATWQARVALDMPLVSMAMGELGVLSRIAGHLFGSSLTFAAGANASAPGQMPIDRLRAAIALLESSGNAR